MSAPGTTARVTPTGYKLPNGFSTKVAFARRAGLNIWEISVKPPGRTGGDPIKTDTMFNTLYNTQEPRALTMITNGKMKFAYDPGAESEIQTYLINQNGAVTVRRPDGSTLDFYGYMNNVEFSDHVEGEMPTGECDIVVTNWDPVARVEQGPVVTSVAGT